MLSVNKICQHSFAGFYKALCYLLLLLIPQQALFASESQSNAAAMWENIEMRGTQQSVYFHVWGGDQQINNYIQWVAKQVKQQYDIDLHHVKLTDTSEAVSRVLAEKSASNHRNGQVDLVWINGANFASMAKHKLLALDWADKLPNFALTNPENNPAMTRDFGVPTEGMEAPWGQAALTFYYDSLKVEQPPQTLAELLSWTKQHPGRFTYPKPPEFLGMSFLKYALIILNENQPDNIKDKLYQAATPESEAQTLPALWNFLDELHPNLWRQGHHFVANGLALRRLSGDGELQVSFTFSAAEIPSAIARYDLPDSTRSYRMLDGSLSNIHFVAIPYNSPHLDSAKLVANFLLSPKAQAKKQQTSVWGDSSVLDLSQLSPTQHAYFDMTEKRHLSANIINVDNTRLLSELHPSWSAVITKQWLARYGVQ
ncbi:ABC transporter substrate-binding protein [Psychromonas sp. GE-S-Ul-11]|uniref:ABC transporter substrate-binding protein n=1 Tax=Psychromonas sp. GE-S-Ul-11 TaxID=3241170 RepID=UPI003AAE4CB5